MIQKTYSPLNSIIFISDEFYKNSPDVKGFGVFSNSECIVCTCYPEIDGPTKFFLAELSELSLQAAPEFQGAIVTPSKRLRLATVDEKIILETKVTSTRTGVSIWRSHPKWPETVTVGWYVP
jgi:hypothetical protein